MSQFFQSTPKEATASSPAARQLISMPVALEVVDKNPVLTPSKVAVTDQLKVPEGKELRDGKIAATVEEVKQRKAAEKTVKQTKQENITAINAAQKKKKDENDQLAAKILKGNIAKDSA